MANNPNGAAECSIEVFGSWVTETAPANLPVGVSPDCPDNVFAPGTVGTRPAFQRIFNPPLAPGATVVYGKSFVTPSGDVKNLFLDSLGNFYVEDVSNTPLTATVLFTTTPGTACKSITAFGREFIAISDGLHGQEAPLQYDGTNVDRVTVDGPGTPPTVASVAYPAVPITTIPSVSATIATITAEGSTHGFYLALIVTLTAPCPFAVGSQVAISGAAVGAADGTWTITGVSGNVFGVGAYFSTTNPAGSGGAVATLGAGTTLARNGNAVTAYTSAAHNLQPGYQALISAVAASALGGGIASVVVDNEDLPGIATITTNSPHGLEPDNDVFLAGIAANVLTIATFNYVDFVVDIVTTAAHGLSVGSSILAALGGGILAPQTVIKVISPTEFLCGTLSSGSAGGSGGSVQYIFPLASATGLASTFSTSATAQLNTQTYEVTAAPTPTTFQIAFEYTDGTWTGGTVSFAWNGTFFVTAVPSPTSFVYQQYGPNVATAASGTATPYGQLAPGPHQLQISFLTRQGFLTAPSPPVKFIANGGQYLSVNNMAIGPGYVVARVIEVTGALGSLFFYIPVPAQVNGLVVSTATQIDDNTTTSAILDFSDNTLYAALGTSIPGNNLAAQIVLDGALGFLFSSTRLGTYGQRNCLQNLLNMGFGGGYLPSAPTLPTGWTAVGVGGTLGAGRFDGFNWAINTGVGRGQLTQSFYEDAYGAPIGTANTLYKVRYYLGGAGTFQATISSASTGFSSTATIVFAAAGWYEATFTLATPNTIPPDMLYGIQGLEGVLTVAEGSAIYAQTPYLDTVLFDSYVNNAEAFDGLSGKYGPTQDTRKVMTANVVRGTLCLLTQEPSGRLHEVIDNGTSEPAGWTVNELDANCGILSSFAATVSQADDGSASGGEEWMAWASESGARIFGGGDQWKISQEIQPNWFDPNNPAQVGAGQINMAAALTAWAMNDPVERVVYIGLPLGAATSPSQIYPMNYRELDDAYSIAHSPPFHPSLAGKLVATDNTRKWSYWQRAFNGAARMYRGPGQLTTCFFSGTFGNAYLLNPALSTDDDYGQIGSYYVTCALPTHEQEQALQLGSQKKLLASLNAFFTCVGNVTFTIYRNALAYPWPIVFTRPSATYFDMEMGGGNPEANRMFFKIQPVPVVGGVGPAATDCRYLLTRFIPFFRKAKIPARGAAQ